MDMDKYERTKNIARTSPSISKLTRVYGYEVMECIQENRPVPTLAEFYKANVGGEIPRSRIWEKYMSQYRKDEKKE